MRFLKSTLPVIVFLAAISPGQFTRFFAQWLGDSRVAAILPFALTAGGQGEWQGFAWTDSLLQPGDYFMAVSSLRISLERNIRDGSSGRP